MCVRLFAALAILLTVSFSGYVLWDTEQIYDTAGDVQLQLRQYKPVAMLPQQQEERVTLNQESDDPFQELQEINPDICAWLDVKDTNIDYPIVQGANNQTYLNMDIFGQFSLAGSIYLDSRNSRDFSDAYSLIYGHHMDNHAMFGDLDEFKDPEFFASHSEMTVTTPKHTFACNLLAVLHSPDSTDELFYPTMWKDDVSRLGHWLQGKSDCFAGDVLADLIAHGTERQVIALVTCSTGSTGIRTVLLFVTERQDPSHHSGESETPHSSEESGGQNEQKHHADSVQTGDPWNFDWMMLPMAATIMCILSYQPRRKKQSE